MFGSAFRKNDIGMIWFCKINSGQNCVENKVIYI
jgi:hypothetical protein